MRTYRAVGLMSGTSLDGVDAALIETDGERVAAFGPAHYRPYTEDERARLRAAIAEAAALADRVARPGALADAERLVNDSHAEAVEALLTRGGLDRAGIDVVGFHGQTVLHRPERRLTVQIGDGPALAARLRLPVVYDFRAADIAAGGQGAPLVPIFHRALAQALPRPRPVAVLNVGGVANVTVIDGVPEPFACDTGPGNALIDDFMRVRTGTPHDTEGAQAFGGRVDEAAVKRALAHPFFARKPPKSLDRNDFREWAEQTLDLAQMSVADGAATLTALTAAAVATVVSHLPRPPATWIVTGGGASNPALLAMLTARLAPAQVERAHAVGWNADALEAQAFAYLAVRSLRGLPLTFPSTTGAPRPLAGGMLARPRAS